MIRRTILAAFTVGIVVTEARAQANLARPQILATRIDAAPRVDGRLDDAVWANARWTSGFTQREPVEGAPATSPTRIAIAYDDDALYIAARMESATPVRALVTRRDREGSSEQLVVSLDTYHDLRTSYSFAVTAAGVRIDYHHAEDNRSSREYTFDPVWEARTAIDSGGWTAEIRIPFTQTALRGDAEADVGNQCGTHHPGAGRRGLPRPRAPQRIGMGVALRGARRHRRHPSLSATRAHAVRRDGYPGAGCARCAQSLREAQRELRACGW